MEQKKLYRSHTDKVIAGVCGGLGEFFAIDATIFRILFVILAVMGGSGILLYIILMIVIPGSAEQAKRTTNPHDFVDTAKETVAESAENVREKISTLHKTHGWGSFFGLILILIGLLALFNNLFPGIELLPPARIFWPLIFIFFGLYIAIGRRL